MALDRLVRRGFLVQMSIPDKVAPTLDQITDLAKNTGFPPEFLPKAKSKRNAFELSFNDVLGKKGMLVDVRMDVRKQKVDQYGVEPFARIKHEVSSAAAPILRRTLVEVHYVPFARADDGTGDSKAKYLDLCKVAAVEFDTNTNQRFVTYLAAPASWVDRQAVENVVYELKNYQDKITAACIASDIRAGLRDFLISRNRIQLVKSASYYIPEKDGVAQELSNMRDFVRGLGSFCSENPVAYVFQIAPWDDQAIADIKQASINDLSERMFALKREIKGLKKPADDESKKKYDKQLHRLSKELFEVKEVMNTVKSSLNEDMSVLEMVYATCEAAIIV